MSPFDINNLLMNRSFERKGLKFVFIPSTESPIDGVIKQIKIGELSAPEIVADYSIQQEQDKFYISINYTGGPILPSRLDITSGFIPDGKNPEDFIVLNQ